jgi:hypothetical protein
MLQIQRNPQRCNVEYLCPICDKPVILETAKTDDDGRAVHEECYLDVITGKILAQAKKPPASRH